jgi:hypothetical protein
MRVVGPIVLAALAAGALALSPACRGQLPTCDEGEADCPGVGCINTSNSAAHCGACGHACPPCYRCTFGECDPQCCAAEMNCGTRYELECVNTMASREHCGTCETACAEDETCLNGTCTLCAPPRTVCANACADLDLDIQHCGRCDSPCTNNQFCNCGVCADDPAPPEGCGGGDGDADGDADSDAGGDGDLDLEAGG